MRRIAGLVKASEPELVEQVEKLIAVKTGLERQIDQLKTRVAQSAVGMLEGQAHSVNGSRVLAARVEDMDRQQMRELTDSLRNKWKTAVVALASAENSSVSIVIGVTKDLTSKVHAGKLVGTVAQAVGGKGGGRPDMAEAGGKDPAALPKALADVYASVEGML